MRKLVFFDLDGTLCDMRTGIAEQTKKAIRQLIQNGHYAFLCTGRSRAFIPPETADMGFLGIVAACGAYLERNNCCIYNAEQPVSIARKSVEILRRNGLVPVMEGPSYMYYDTEEYTDQVDWFSSLITEQLGSNHRPIQGNENVMHVNKISAKKLPGCNVANAIRELAPYYDAIEHEGDFVGTTVELIIKGASKADGMKRMIETLGYRREDTVAFGDSNNDLSMFAYAALKIAMGDGSEALKQQADYITSSMHENGIEQGLRHLGLLEQ